MTELTNLLAVALRDSSFDSGTHGTFTADQIRLVRSRGGYFGSYVTYGTRVVVPEARLARLVDALGRELGAFIEPDTQRLGTGLVSLMGGAMDAAEPTVAGFARSLVRAALILGPVRAVEILRGWIEGEPYRYRMMMLLTGVRCEQPLSLEEGVRITRLPNNSAEVAACLPRSLTSMGIDVTEYMGRAVVEIDGTAGPALYRPTRSEDESTKRDFQGVWAAGRLPALTTDMWRERLTDALSLACNHHVRWTHIWRDVGEIRAFHHGSGGHESNPAQSPGGSTVRLEQRHLEAARDLDAQRDARVPGRKSLDIAIGRWIGSKRPYASLADRFIDLRIALEALYLDGSGGELRFRLAFFGAWDLGGDFEQRRRYYDLLRKAYDLCSTAVHSGHVKDSAKSWKMLADVHDACRQAILNRLAESEAPARDQIDRALGAPAPNRPS